MKPISISQLIELLIQEKPIQLIDVRSDEEWLSSHLKEAIHIPFDMLENSPLLSKDLPIILYCKSGYRAEVGAEILQKKGIDSVYVTGHITSIPLSFIQ